MSSNAPKVEIVGHYNGRSKHWVIGRFLSTNGDPGGYRIGSKVEGGFAFLDRSYTNREDAEAFLIYQLDDSVNL